MIYIVTPCWNAVDTIERTILSVVTQAGDFDITYHIQDGGSTDGTVELLSRWKSRIDNGQFPIQCQSITFTYNSAPDTGMYDAIVTGVERFTIGSAAFMSWINADDTLSPNALALIEKVCIGFGPEHVSWIGGAASILKDDVSIIQILRPTPTAVIARGLCDGQHWTFLQQEGMFFRKWLWDKIAAPAMLRSFKYAGDWNLWRLFAQNAKYVQYPYPLGNFRTSEGQLSQVKQEDYKNEIEAVLTWQERRGLFRNICNQKVLDQRFLKLRYPDGEMSVIEKSALGTLKHFYEKNYRATNTYELPLASCLSKETTLFKATSGDRRQAADERTRNAGNESTVPGASKVKRIDPTKFNDFTYAKKSHWDLFEGLDFALFGTKMDPNVEQLKIYQDLLVLKFISDNVPQGARVLEVGGGQSRILKHLENTYECWNIDKLEGVGNGPTSMDDQSCRLVRDYMGNFNPELPEDYFDFVFSISALEHVPQDEPSLFDDIIMDIQRVLKDGGYSLHLFDIILKQNNFWSNKITDHIFSKVKTCNRTVDFKTMKADSDLYVMTEAAFNMTWRHTVKKDYLKHGQPCSLNVLWLNIPDD